MSSDTKSKFFGVRYDLVLMASDMQPNSILPYIDLTNSSKLTIYKIMQD